MSWYSRRLPAADRSDGKACDSRRAVLDAVREWGAIPVPAVLFVDAGPPPLHGIELVSGRATEPILEEPTADESERRIDDA